MSITSLRQTINKDYEKPDEGKIEQFQTNLFENEQAYEYLTKERLLTEETIIHFKLGYDKVKDAISIPIYKDGELVNIKYRLLNPEMMKYTQEKGCEVWVFNEEGFSEGLRKKGIAITEGEFDSMILWQNGITNVVSPASGKDSYGVWIEKLDKIPRIYLILDNDKGGRETAKSLADRAGVEKSYDVLLPKETKDITEYFQKGGDIDGFKELIREAKPFHSYAFQELDDIIQELKQHKGGFLELDLMPKVKMENDWMVVASGRSNSGKTAYCLNLANELTTKGIPTLVMPFERGIKSVGKRFIEIRTNRSMSEMDFFQEEDWNNLIDDMVGLPLYFSKPEPKDIEDTIRKAKRLFGVQVVIADQPDYDMGGNDKYGEMDKVIKGFKELCIELGVIFIFSHHIRKQSTSFKPVEPEMEDLKGTTSVYTVPEAVIMLSKDSDTLIQGKIAKNKGESGNFVLDFNGPTGRMTPRGEIKSDEYYEDVIKNF